ncbi:MAG: glycoside hydrolase family 31 protein [Candidatus Thermoplasmatota archaeon]|nr:glycoside hydrolase family 31 protein [Candidatus Thermoplasmatota archaeon]
MRNEADFDIYGVFNDGDFKGIGSILGERRTKDALNLDTEEFDISFSLLNGSTISIDVSKKGKKPKKVIATGGSFGEDNSADSISLSDGYTATFKRGKRFTLTIRKNGRRILSDFTHDEVDGTFRLGSELDNFLTYNNKTNQLRFSFTIPANKGIYGVGESFTRYNKWGTRIVTFPIDNNGQSADGVYKGIPFFLSNAGIGLLVNTYSPVEFNFGAKLSCLITVTVPLDCVSLVVFTGEPKKIISLYESLDRKPALPPKWSFGLWISRWIGVAYKSVKEIEQTLQKFDEYSIPVEVVALDPQWLGDYYPGLQVCEFKWNRERFKSDNEVGDYLKSKGLHLSLWVNPYLNLKSEFYKKYQDVLLKTRDNEFALVPDPDPLFRPPRAMWDFSNPDGFNAYKGLIKELLVRSNADCVMTDFGETVPLSGVDHYGDEGFHIRNELGDLYQLSAFEGALEANRENMIWGRSGSIRSHTVAIQWNGDSNSSWEGMRNTLAGSLSYLTSGALFTSFDIPGTGGLIGEKIEKQTEEQYCRWVELGSLFSHIKIHGSLPEPWHYGRNAIAVFKKYMELRYSLLPYIWDEAKYSFDNGVPLVRSLLLEFPEDPSVTDIGDQFMLGKDIMVAPIFDESGYRQIYIPKGKWVDFWSREKIDGGEWIEDRFPLDILPIYVRSGSKIRMFSKIAMRIKDLDLNSIREEKF